MSDQPKPSAAQNLLKKSDRRLMLIAVVLVFGLLLSIVLYMLSKQQAKDTAIIQKEIQTISVSDQNLASLNQFVDLNSSQIDKIFAVFPKDTDIISVLETIESKIKQYDEDGSVNISSPNAAKKHGEMQITLQINLNGSIYDLTRLMRELEKLPFILKFSSIDINSLGGDQSAISIGTTLYVDDPFVEKTNHPQN